MKFQIITIFPEMVKAVFEYGVIKRAVEDKVISYEAVDLRKFAKDKHKSVDDEPYGGGPGMVMMAEPICLAVKKLKGRGKTPKGHAILLSPHGKPLTQKRVRELAELDTLILICGRYEGIDQRVVDLVVDEEVSLGDFVLSGGELAAMVLVDAVARHVPEVLGNEDSTKDESFAEGLLDYPHYTRPVEYQGLRVPDVLLSGDHKKIAAWRRAQSRFVTALKRPDLFRK
jgi:tRNA (guanine37-N1)-methyltransferase